VVLKHQGRTARSIINIGAWRSPASALALGARGRRFESCRPDLYYIYILYSEQLQRYYVGSTEDVARRLQEHNAGKSKSTRAGSPWKLIHTESFATRSDAMERERKVKARGIGRYLVDIQPK
jgi:putative endonuclease